MTPKRNWRKLTRWSAAFGITSALIAGADAVTGAPPRHAAPCRCTVDGVCTPNVYTYGYYQTQWRSWPKPLGAEASSSTQRSGTKLPTQVEPPPGQEDSDIAPRPATKPEATEAPPVKPATGDEIPRRPRTKPPVDDANPFRDDPPNEQTLPDEKATERRMSVLIPPANETVLDTSDDGAVEAVTETANEADVGAAAGSSITDAAREAVREVVEESNAEASNATEPTVARTAPPKADAVRSSFEAVARRGKRIEAAAQAVATSDEPSEDRQPLRLVEASPTEPASATATGKRDAPAAGPAKLADGANPLRSGWGARRASTTKSGRDPQVVTTFDEGESANPLRR